MDFVVKDGDIVTLEDGKKYFVLKTTQYNGSNYCTCIILPEVLKPDMQLDDSKVEIVKENVSQNGAYLQIIKDKTEIDLILNLSK